MKKASHAHLYKQVATIALIVVVQFVAYYYPQYNVINRNINYFSIIEAEIDFFLYICILL